MDQGGKKISGLSSSCRVAIDFSETVSLKELKELCQKSDLISWLSALRVSRSFIFSLPQWKSLSESGVVSVEEFESDEELPETLLAQEFDPFEKSLLRFDLCQRSNGKSTLFFTWSHILMDARGAEMLILHLGGCQLIEKEENFFPKSARSAESFVDKLNRSKKIKEYLFEKDFLPYATLGKKGSDFRSAVIYKKLSFTAEETRQMDALALKSPARLLKSLYYLSATARSFYLLLKKCDLPTGNLLVPVPQDGRRRGAKGPVVSNEFSFMFYRIRETTLDSRDACIEDLTSQMKKIMKEEYQKSYRSFMSVCQRLPRFIYTKLICRPGEGAAPSFIFSDTGNSLKDFDHFMGQKLEQVSHFPPNSCPPGFTVIFSRYNDCLNVTLAHMKNLLTEEQQYFFETSLREGLLAGE
jgi:hypothetical protein